MLFHAMKALINLFLNSYVFSCRNWFGLTFGIMTKKMPKGEIVRVNTRGVNTHVDH